MSNTTKKPTKPKKKALRAFDMHLNHALAWACAGARSLIVSGNDDHCVIHLSRTLTQIEIELAKLSDGEPVPVGGRAMLLPTGRPRHDGIAEPRLRLAAMLGSVGHDLTIVQMDTTAGRLRRAREGLADIIVLQAQAVMLAADINAEQARIGMAA